MESTGLLIICWGGALVSFCLCWFAGRAGLHVYRNLKQRKTRIGNPAQST